MNDLQEKIIGEIVLKPVDQSMSEILPPGHKFESMFTANDLSYTVKVCFVNLQSTMWGITHSYSNSDTLIKYSEAQYSPVSPEPTDHLRLATLSYYRNLKVEANSELLRDDLEGAYIERKNLREYVRVKIKKALLHDCWIYCVSIVPNTNYKRIGQIESLSPDYDFITKIEKPSEFAKQLGRDVGKHISIHENLKCDQPGLHIMTSTVKEILEKQGGFIGKHLISVNHGPVIYLNEDEIQEYMNNIPNVEGGSIIPFVKRKKYENQQEYRFVVSVQWHSPTEDILDLQVSDDLRKLMAPIEGSRY